MVMIISRRKKGTKPRVTSVLNSRVRLTKMFEPVFLPVASEENG